MDHDGDIDICFSPIGTTRIQWRRNINLSWMKAIARSKKNPKACQKVPIAPHTQLQTVLVTDAATHLSCSSSAHKDCKCVSKHVMHQWAVCWNEVTYQPDETSVCSYYMGLFLVDPQYGAACGVKDWSIQNPLHVKELSQTSAGGFLSSITQGPNE
ncbi:unnamed protein product [Prunus armeniaca]